MYWDKEAAKAALGWANSMCHARGGGPDHDPITARFIPGRNAYGQNWFCSGGQGTTWQEVIKSWCDEKTEENFSYEEGGNQATGHYSQVMWADSVLVGCAMLYCDVGNKGEYFVCNYARAGNEPGYYGKMDRPYIRSNTTKGSDCGTNYNSKTGLCDCKDVKFCLNGGKMNPKTCKCTCPKVPWIVGPNCELDCSKGVKDEPGFDCVPMDCESDDIFDMCPDFCNLCSGTSGIGEAAKIMSEQPKTTGRMPSQPTGGKKIKNLDLLKPKRPAKTKTTYNAKELREKAEENVEREKWKTEITVDVIRKIIEDYVKGSNPDRELTRINQSVIDKIINRFEQVKSELEKKGKIKDVEAKSKVGRAKKMKNNGKPGI
ncbi:cysteine-rich venom protein Mr30-like [Tubulanus polymorphus]|uniref:cysteine-rich venom protein Mr30-like n=1 Tax=Tubulanus polymorphus TaxID=672921 RepID=UPI003DA2944E